MSDNINASQADWSAEEFAIARNAIAEHRRKLARERYQAARLEYHLQGKEGDSIDFRDMHHRGGMVSGVITARGSHAGWALVDGVETRFDYMDTLTIWRDGEAL